MVLFYQLLNLPLAFVQIRTYNHCIVPLETGGFTGL